MSYPLNFYKNKALLVKYLVGFAFIPFLIPIVSAAEQSTLDGVWFLTGSETPENLYLTPAGQETLENYDVITDDGDNYCIPVSFTNTLHTPSPPFEIRLHEDYVEINYEFMDVKRRVPLDASLTVENAPYTVSDYPHLGRSVGRFEAEILVVDTAGQEDGVLDTGNVSGVAGLPQSVQMRTEERFIVNGDELKVIIRHNDPVNYSNDLIVRYSFHRIDAEIMEWNCEPETAGYDKYLESQED